jgi:P27 family predicted phage terminase small subunit
MGRRKPNKIKRLEGTERKSRDKPATTIGQLGKPNAPDWLNKQAKSIFRMIATDLYSMGIMLPEYKYQLAILSAEYAQYIEAQRRIQQEGLTLIEEDTAGNPKSRKHPAAEIATTKSRTISTLLDNFGLNPAARERISRVESASSGDDDPLEDYLDD